jgi:phage gpG-like protein
MKPNEFERYLAKMQLKIDRLTATLPDKAANRAVRIFKDNFKTESFIGGAKWQKSKKNRGKTLTKTGDLGRSIRYKVSGDTATVFSDLAYSAVHNEGGIIDVKPHHRSRNGKRYQVKGYAYRAVKRQFIGDSPKLVKAIEQVIEKELDKIFE